MSVPLTGAGSLFVRAGHLGGLLKDINALRGGTTTTDVTATVPAKLGSVESDYQAGAIPHPDLIDGIQTQLTSWQSAQGGFLAQLAGYLSATIVRMVNDDAPQSNSSLKTALTTLIGQMVGAAASVQEATVTIGAAIPSGTPNGTPQIVLSGKDSKGAARQLVYPETLSIVCTSDSQSGGTLNQEPLSITGAAAVSDPLSYQWPAGSGATASLSAVDASQNNSGGTLLVNGDWTTFSTANIPDNWTIGPGTPGTTVFSAGSVNTYDSNGNALQITGNGAELTALTQAFATTSSSSPGAGGTPAKLAPLTQYAFALWIKVPTVPGAGVLTIDLVDGGGNVTNDASGVANSVSVSLPGLAAGVWTTLSGTLRTPAVLPSTLKLRVHLSTALTSADVLYLDRLALTPMTAIYQGGPAAAVFSGASKLIVGDTWTVAVTNTYGEMQKLFQRCCNLLSLGLQLPASAAPTIVDSLIS